MSRLRDLIVGYLFPGIIGAVAGLVSAGTGLAGALGGGNSNTGYGSGVPYYTPPNQGGQGQNWNQLLQQLFSGAGPQVPGQVDQAMLNSLRSSLGINYGPLINAGIGAGGQYGAIAGQTAGAGNSLLGASNSILNSSMDPQNALYQRTLGQVTDQANATNSQYGLGNSPVGAELTNTATNNFNIDWQNNALQRMIQGGQAASGLNSSAINLLSAVPGFTLQSGQVPVQAEQYAAAQPGQAGATYANQIGTAQNPLQSILPYLSNYLGMGQSAAQGATGAYGQYGNQIGQAGSAIGSGLNQFGNSSTGQQFGNWLGSLFNSGGGGSGSGGGGSLASTFSGGGYVDPLYGSERAMKQDIRPIGRTPAGLTVYRFRYRPQFRARYGDAEYTGVMADEVQARFPAAIEVVDGLRHVRYGRIA